MAFIENRTFAEINIGDTASLQHTLRQKDIDLFVAMTGDVNPTHVDEQYAKDTVFHKIIAHGMWGASLLSTVLGTKLPGPGTLYLTQDLKFEHPIALGDTVTVSVTVMQKHEQQHTIELACQCTNQLNEVVISGVATVIAPVKKVKRQRMVLPQFEVRTPTSQWYEHLVALKGKLAPMVTAVVHPVDNLSLTGAIASAEAGLIIPVLVGPEDKIRAVADDNGIDLSSYTIVNTRHSHEAAETAVQMTRQGEVEALMKGKIHTDELMKPIIDKDNGLRTGRRMSHIFAMDVPNYPKPLFLTDAAINIKPNLSEKRDIVQNAIDLFLALGLGTPKVAIVSAVETVNEHIPSTLDATALCKMAERGQITGGLLDGPLAFDSAISMQSANVKDLHSPVAGNADVVVVPDVESGNMLYKQMTYLSGTEAAGIVIGATVPIILTSRGSGVLSRKASSAMALRYVRQNLTSGQ
jgi:phosphate acetyltransferase